MVPLSSKSTSKAASASFGPKAIAKIILAVHDGVAGLILIASRDYRARNIPVDRQEPRVMLNSSRADRKLQEPAFNRKSQLKEEPSHAMHRSGNTQISGRSLSNASGDHSASDFPRCMLTTCGRWSPCVGLRSRARDFPTYPNGGVSCPGEL